ncbi:hypothetical protein L596_029893 [Steinernema carpocapsae]|uniref:Uncharacterized protein n=1 Tax=Steinernema carpocapsae TaxID=34508 RepID=A0A4U5LR36_STECR|nr:hypothetical protein L596_029893 [Steinernema carpocapsae]
MWPLLPREPMINRGAKRGVTKWALKLKAKRVDEGRREHQRSIAGERKALAAAGAGRGQNTFLKRPAGRPRAAGDWKSLGRGRRRISEFKNRLWRRGGGSPESVPVGFGHRPLSTLGPRVAASDGHVEGQRWKILERGGGAT